MHRAHKNITNAANKITAGTAHNKSTGMNTLLTACQTTLPQVVWNISQLWHVRTHTGVFEMASTSRIFFAGVGTTFVVLALGFGGGLMLANTALKEPSSLQARANSNSMSPVRVILPTTAEAAQPPQQSPAFVMTAEPSQQLPTAVREVQAPLEKQSAKADIRRAEAEERERRKRYAERKAKKIAIARAHQQEQQPREPRIIALGGDEPRPASSLFGN
jgi:hypothetical protein